jgi:hypothetical protein
MPAINRNVVLWYGQRPNFEEEREFNNRNLTVKVTESGGKVDFSIACAIVFYARPPDVKAAFSCLSLICDALNQGLMVYAIADDDEIQRHLQQDIPEIAKSGCMVGCIRSRTGNVPASEIAENIARHDAGRHANIALEIKTPKDVDLSVDSIFFIRRAFNDCVSVVLSSMPGGRSADAFSVQATLIDSDAGPRPMPFFIKLDAPEKISTEATNYRLYASHHIPWYLRPNLDPSRCLYGVKCGILVGSFVEHSQSLWDIVINGGGVRYLHLLYEDTLLGWRSQAYKNPPRSVRMANALANVFKWENMPKKNVDQAKEHGLVCEPKEIWEKLISLPELQLRIAPIHGDMHAENVRVRNNDAIIIDLANVRLGPLSADIASMEVWLAFQVPKVQDDIPDRARWTVLLSELFSPKNIPKPPSLESVDCDLDWLRSCVRQTRMIAASVCDNDTEYATALAIYLLRHSSFSDDNEEDLYRRGYAYFIGSKLVDWLSEP